MRLRMDYWFLCICLFAITGQTLGQFTGQQQPRPAFNQPQPVPGTFPTQNMNPAQNPRPQAVPGAFPTQNMNPAQNPPPQAVPGAFPTQNMNPTQNGAPQPVPTAFIPAQPGMANPNQPQQPGTGSQVPNQAQGTDTSQFTCATAGRAAVAQCFLQNGGFQMINVIALLSNGTQGQLPANSDQVKAQLCQAEKQITSCVFGSVVRFNGTQQCNTVGSFVRLQQETVGLLNGVQQLCGTGIIPRVTPCMRRLSYDIMQCYEKVGLNPGLYTPGGSRMEGAVIGDNREAAKMFCDKRRELFDCQDKVLDDCPGAQDLQAISGNDQKSLQAGMDILCKDVSDYVSGLVCFQQPTPAVQDCASDLVRDMTDVTMSQIRNGLTVDAFFVEYCNARIRNLRCDNKAWGGVCEPVAVGLKSEFQCNLLPNKCKNSPKVRDLYQQVCSVSSFARNLRTPDSGASSMWAGLTTVATSLGVAVLMLI